MKHAGHSSLKQKVCSNTGSFTVPRDIEDRPSSLHAMPSAEVYNNFSFFAHTRQHDKYDVESVCHGLNDDDRAMLTLYTERQESRKASNTQQLIGKKRKEATQQEIRAYTKPFLEAKQLECKSWLDNEVFDLVETRKLQVRNWVTGRWALTIKRDRETSSRPKHVGCLEDFKIAKRTSNKRTARSFKKWIQISSSGSGKQRVEHIPHGPEDSFPAR